MYNYMYIDILYTPIHPSMGLCFCCEISFYKPSKVSSFFTDDVELSMCVTLPPRRCMAIEKLPDVLVLTS